MKNNILNVIKRLEELETDFNFSELETGIYLYCRFGKNQVKDLTEEDFEDIYNNIQDFDGSLFNEDINDYMYSNFPNI